MLLVAEELDTSGWFDLKKYEVLKTMSIEGWASVLESRSFISECYDSAEQEDFDWPLPQMAGELKAGDFLVDAFVDVYINQDYAKEMLRNDYSFSTSTVNNIKNYQAWDMAEGGLLGEFSAFQKMRDEWLRPFEDDENKDGLLEVAHAPYDLRFKQILNRNYIGSSAHVEINLNAPDEQILNDFSHWLKHYRKASGCHVPKKKAHKKLFTQKTFNNWIEFGLIPYLDLVLIAKIEGKDITQEKLGELIFPNEPDVNTEYRIRTVTKPEAERLMEKATRSSILMQAANEKATRTKNT